jgi:hypothetical protein
MEVIFSFVGQTPPARSFFSYAKKDFGSKKSLLLDHQNVTSKKKEIDVEGNQC